MAEKVYLTEVLNVRVDAATLEALRELARRNERSVGAEIRLAIRDRLTDELVQAA